MDRNDVTLTNEVQWLSTYHMDIGLIPVPRVPAEASLDETLNSKFALPSSSECWSGFPS